MNYISTMVLKSSSDVFRHLTANLANLSFIEGVFPSSFKVDQVMPLLEKSDASMENISNYLSITNIKTIRKILERHAMKQMRRHMENSPNLGPLQTAYQALHSIETAMARVVNDFLSSSASKSPSVLLLLDIRVAFDTLDHHCLLERAKDLFGFDSTVLQWLGSYLVEREQFVGVASCHFLNGKVVFWPTAGLGSRAAAILRHHNTGRQPHFHIHNMEPLTHRRHAIVHGH